MTRDELIATVKRYTFDRTDLDDMMGYFIASAEQDMRVGLGDGAPLRLQSLLKTTTLTLTDGKATLPTDFVRLDRVVVDGVEPSFIPALNYDPLDKCSFTIEAGEIYASGETLKILYLSKFSPLVGGTDTNEVSDEYPALYVNLMVHHAGLFLTDNELSSSHLARAMSAITKINSEHRQRVAPRYGLKRR